MRFGTFNGYAIPRVVSNSSSDADVAKALAVVKTTGFKWEAPDYFDVDARGIAYFSFCAPVVKLGAASFYLGTFKDADSDRLRPDATYRLRVPADVPARDFWAVTVYDPTTHHRATRLELAAQSFHLTRQDHKREEAQRAVLEHFEFHRQNSVRKKDVIV